MFKKLRSFYIWLFLACLVSILVLFNNTSNMRTYQPISLMQKNIQIENHYLNYKNPTSNRLQLLFSLLIKSNLNKLNWSKLELNSFKNRSNVLLDLTSNDLLTLFSSSKFTSFNEELINLNAILEPASVIITHELLLQLAYVLNYLIQQANFKKYYLNFVDQIYDFYQLDRLLITILQNNALATSGMMHLTDIWQPILGSAKKARVYSAYYENRLGKEHFVRIISAASTHNAGEFYCAFWYLNSTSTNQTNNLDKQLFVVPAVTQLIRENWNLKYSAYYIICPLKNYSLPDAVSILANSTLPQASSSNLDHQFNGQFHVLNSNNSNKLKFALGRLGNFLFVQNNHKKYLQFASKHELALCVKPFHYEYNKLDNLIEFIELNRLLGVNHFFFYNHTMGSKIDCLLKTVHFDSNLVTMLPWEHLDMQSQKEIRTEGIFAALNDCLYRAMYRYKYVLTIDLDEFIIPNLDENLNQLLNRLNLMTSSLRSSWLIQNLNLNKVVKTNSTLPLFSRIGAYSFQNAFFYLDWPDDPIYKTISNENNLKIKLITLAKTQRKLQFHRHRQRSKLIVLPEYTIEVGNHFVWQFLPGKTTVHVNSKIAYLHHYRICEFGGTDCLKTSSIIDRTAYNWSTKLILNVQNVYNNFVQLKCPLN